MIQAQAAWAVFRRVWWLVPIAILLVMLAAAKGDARHWQKKYAGEHEARLQVVADYTAFAHGVRERSNEIVSKAAERKRRVEAAQARIMQEKDSEIRRRIDAAVAAVRLRTQGGANPGSGGNARTGAAPAPAGTARAGETALVPASDLEICAENTVKAEGWQSWWRSIREIPR